MQKYYYIFCFAFVLPIFGFAQVDSTHYKNTISVDPFVYAFGTIQFQYERSIADKFSVSLSVGGKLSSGLFSLRGINGSRITTDDFDFKGIKIIPEFRWYMQRHRDGITGFYSGAYFKYQDYTDRIDGNYIDASGNDNPIILDANIRTFALGIQVGYKLKVINRFYIDFIIAGPGLSFNTFELDEIEPIPDAFYDDLSNALSDYDIFDFVNSDFRINANTKSDTVVLPAFRYGIKLGYSF